MSPRPRPVGSGSAEHRSAGQRPHLQTQLLLVAMALVLAAVLFYPPRGDDDNAASSPTPSTATETATASVPTPSEEEFCAEFRRLASAQGEYAAVPDETATGLLREAVDRMVAVGVPQTMTLPARGGYHTVLDGIYGSLGISLDRSAVGALDEPVAAEDAAFSSYLLEFCPA